MSIELEQSPSRLRSLRDVLLGHYDDETVHQLRVLLRRIRSELRVVTGERADALQRELRDLARCTNSARDWDTLVTWARQQLSREPSSKLLALLQARREQSHDEVYRLLHSHQWITATGDWEDYLQSGFADKVPGRPLRQPGEVKRRCVAAGQKALARESDRCWHKLRIAIKELRYTLEHAAGDTQDPATAELLERCKFLQTLLGDWHDTVIHRQLLAELSGSDAIEAVSPARRTVDALHRERVLEGERLLKEVRLQLPALLQP